MRLEVWCKLPVTPERVHGSGDDREPGGIQKA